jgi:hypothetical protein
MSALLAGTWQVGSLVLVSLAGAGVAPALAQSVAGKSPAPARELAALMDSSKLDSVAARDPSAPDVFVAALYFPGRQLLVVSAKYQVPLYLTEQLDQKSYKAVYIDLQSGSIPESRVFVDDLGADGLHARPSDNQPFDSYESGAKRTTFDGDWRKRSITEQDYMQAFDAADQIYARMLNLLIAQLKKPS